VLLFPGAANRDPWQFAEPDKLDVTRDVNQHFAFGIGAHYCPGASLARAVLEIAIATLLRKLPGLRRDVQTPEWEEEEAVGEQHRPMATLWVRWNVGVGA
jgi:cytochrome P450